MLISHGMTFKFLNKIMFKIHFFIYSKKTGIKTSGGIKEILSIGKGLADLFSA